MVWASLIVEILSEIEGNTLLLASRAQRRRGLVLLPCKQILEITKLIFQKLVLSLEPRVIQLNLVKCVLNLFDFLLVQLIFGLLLLSVLPGSLLILDHR
jgi:hypothetical protein